MPAVASVAPAGTGLCIDLAHVAFSYPGRLVLTDASVQVAFGELVALTGENGTGKSTVVRLVLGEETPRKGVVRVLGEDVSKRRDWTRVGYVPQAAASDFKSFPATVSEMLEGSCLTRRGARARTGVIMAELGIATLASHMLRELSGGQLQRVLLARALVNEPQVLVLDEPTSGLDAENARGFSAAMARAVDARGMGVLLVTHDLARLTLPARHRVLRLEDGVVEDAGADNDFMRRQG